MSVEAYLDDVGALIDSTVAAEFTALEHIADEVAGWWSGALTAAVDYSAFAVEVEPSDEEVQAVTEANQRAAYIAAFVAFIYVGLTDGEARAAINRLGAPANIVDDAVRERLRVLRATVNARTASAFAEAVRDGVPMEEALDRAIRQALLSVGIFTEGEALGAANSGINGVGGFLSNEGLVVTKTWYTRNDTRVRETHAKANGQEVPYSSYFSIDGWPMEYPGDTRAPIGLWANCRCIMVVGSPSVLRNSSPNS